MKQLHLMVWMLLAAGFLSSCNNGKDISDATGTFEADEVIVSSEISGKILRSMLQEGDSIPKDK